ncbi:MAG: hypothetical protein J6S41_00730, partial [Clostridia bacterium]|nr:hypothetical protein [Clostridia bacterium]
MTDTTTVHMKRRWYLLTAVLILLPILLARCVSIVNSFTATDIRYMDTALPTVLYYLRQLFSVISYGAATAALAGGIFRFGGKCGTRVFFLYAGILLADTVAAFLMDILSGAVSGAMIPLALVSGLGNWLFGASLVLIARLVTGRCAKTGRTPARAVLLSAVFCMAERLLLETVYLLQFLIEVEFLPYATEIAVIAFEYLS